VILTEIETRVLGSLIEKDITTPDYYPLSLNAFTKFSSASTNAIPMSNAHCITTAPGSCLSPPFSLRNALTLA
jgi:uncharacterized protein YceH (UPF0502 family)